MYYLQLIVKLASLSAISITQCGSYRTARMSTRKPFFQWCNQAWIEDGQCLAFPVIYRNCLADTIKR